ncbi:GNAT family N-acetyltransferase [Pelagibius litoralis]|uniref:GNAT family N-acetyltransferase n=1 Tax=Pelagibius litoralis TaxID=374515 RepID=A0A967F0K3_9PROT|nr:GNAT family N-acetyltransferase [Pelagibius litoralis]NIA70789.1 GNAT family N-acetyltransferase [Pelagibius litoralis]
MSASIAVTADNRTNYLVRPLRREDRQLIERALKLLSAETLYARFHSRGIRLSARDLDYLTNTDARDHVSWLVIDPSEKSQDGAIALGRYVREAEASSRAEVALTICDRHQGQGVSKVLLGALGASAMAAGIERFHGSLLSENQAMRRLVQSLGAEISIQDGAVVAEAAANPWSLPDTAAAQRVRRVATQVGAALAAQRSSASSVRMRS